MNDRFDVGVIESGRRKVTCRQGPAAQHVAERVLCSGAVAVSAQLQETRVVQQHGGDRQLTTPRVNGGLNTRAVPALKQRNEADGRLHRVLQIMVLQIVRGVVRVAARKKFDHQAEDPAEPLRPAPGVHAQEGSLHEFPDRLLVPRVDRRQAVGGKGSGRIFFHGAATAADKEFAEKWSKSIPRVNLPCLG